MSTKKIERRRFLRRGSLIGLGALLAPKLLAQADCLTTPAQTSGPFYPARRRRDENADLTQVEGHTESATGGRLTVEGTGYDTRNEPVEGALVEIWQACTSGRYDHPDDDNSAPLDPHFQYWGRVTTRADGRYGFKTILPGLYPGRTRHIHYRIVAPNVPTLVTQLYFAGEPRNATDGVYTSLTERQQQLVTTTLADDESGEGRYGRFDIWVGRQCSRELTPSID
jgi:protocatechuate 3,4-dioxygenase beta subunit